MAKKRAFVAQFTHFKSSLHHASGEIPDRQAYHKHHQGFATLRSLRNYPESTAHMFQRLRI
jgi:hypothetical protein